VLYAAQGARPGACAELDAIVLAADEHSARSVWEAKFTLSPSTLADAAGKKLAALKEIVADDGNRLCFGAEGQQLRLTSDSLRLGYIRIPAVHSLSNPCF